MEPGSAEVPADSPPAVEVVVGGKTYPSLQTYKIVWLKEYLRKELSSGALRQFEPQEICDVIRQLTREQKESEASSTAPQNQPSGDAHGAAADRREMEEMLQDYLNEHQDAVPPPALDTGKMKTLIIDPPADSSKE